MQNNISGWLDGFWHGTLEQPYKLSKTLDHGNGPGIVLLHGIGGTGIVWQTVSKLLESSETGCRVVAYDLLGFGASPKPSRLRYDADDHAEAVIAQIERLGRSKPVILVGHSMGCLVAVQIAKTRPDLVRHLVLFEMPIYEGLPNKLHYKTRVNLYYRFYHWITQQNPSFDEASKRYKDRIAGKVVGAELTAASWQPFVKSLQNTIMKQTTAKDLPTLPMPVDIIYGSRDILVIRGKVHKTLGLDDKLVALHTIKERHALSPQASKFIVKRITNALAG